MKHDSHAQFETLALDDVSGGRLINIRLPFGFAIKNRSQQVLDSNRSWEGGWKAASEFYSSSSLGKR